MVTKLSTFITSTTQIGAAVGGGNDEVFFENDKIVTTSYSISANKNAMTTGPIIIDNGVIVTVPTSSRWVVI